ncbi:thermonuclease family protein [Nostoc sp. BAE]|nr:thermonuclease family protein [Nostoc commune BAE]
MKQNPWGQQSVTRLKQLLPVGQSVTVRAIETDKYKRLVAEVFVVNRSVNVSMVQEGQAVVYRQYLKSCPESKDSLLQGENYAKQQRLAFWSQANPVIAQIDRSQRRQSKGQLQQGVLLLYLFL